MIKVLLIDDHQILLDGIEQLINQTEEFEVFATASEGQKALDLLRLHHQNIECIVTDIGLPDIKGPELVRMITKQYPDKKIISLSMHEEKHIIKEMIKSGVDGYVLKRSSREDLIEALAKVNNGENYVSPAITNMLMDDIKNPSIIETLSEREIEIIRLITQEHTTSQIAEKLFISTKTVEAHKSNIFRKTGTSSLVGLTKFAIKHQLID
jgi:DNA-binding NarL/FixJ family response regulator